jgi:hypothetical protein
MSTEKSDRRAWSRFPLDPAAPGVMREEPGRTRKVRRWLVGPDRVELMGEGKRWSARVVRSHWDEAGLVVDGRFGDEAEAIAWCKKMAEVLADDLDDEGDPII